MKTEADKDLKTYKFKVNDTELESQREKLVALDILKLAKNKGAFPGKPEHYVLQGDKGKYKPEDWVDLQSDNMFITIPAEPTPVA